MRGVSLRLTALVVRRCSFHVGIALWLASAVIAAADQHTFTDTSGRTMLAEILEATETTIKVRRDDARVFDLELDKLSAPDRAYVATWRTQRAFASGGIEVAAHRVRLDSDVTQTRSSTRKTEDWCYKFSVANHTRADLADLTIEYRLFFIRDPGTGDRDERPLERIAGRTTIGQLAADAATELQTATVTLISVQPTPGRRYSNTTKRRTNDELAGIWVRVMQQGHLLHEFASPTTLLKSESW